MTSTLADRLKLAMKGPPKVSQVDLAKACGIKPPSVANWLSGKSKTMEGSNLLAASKRLRVNPEWLASNRGTMRNPEHNRLEEERAAYNLDDQALIRAMNLLRELNKVELAEAITFIEWQLSKRHRPGSGNGNDLPVAA